jgi:hypothetical protein
VIRNQPPAQLSSWNQIRGLRDPVNEIDELVTAMLAIALAAVMLVEGPLLHARVGMLRPMNHGREKGVIRSQRDALGASGS